MKKIICTCFVFFVGFMTLFAQTDDIKDRAKENQDNKNNHSGHDDSYAPNDDNLGEGCAQIIVEVACTACSEIAAEVFVELLSGHYRYLKDNRDIDPTPFSIDLMPHVAYAEKYSSFSYMPRIRGTWGVIATDFRINNLLESDQTSFGTFRAWDWQILMLNFAAEGVFNFRIGSGLHYQNMGSDSTGHKIDGYFNQHAIGLEFRMNEQQLLTTLEGRGTWDYETGANVFHEVNLRQSVRFIHTDHLFGYLQAGIIYQNYYDIHRFSFQGGISLNIH